MNNTANGFILIPGFSRYRIHPNTLDLQTSARSPKGIPTVWRTMKTDKGNQVILYDREGGKTVKSHLPRLLYAALHGICPTELGSNAQVVIRDGNLVVTDINECRDYANSIKKSQQTKEHIQRKYSDAISFCQIVLDAYSTGDFSAVIAELHKYENIVIGYLRKRKMASCDKTATELWHSALVITIDALTNHKSLIVNPGYYLCMAARRQYLQNKSERKRMIVDEKLSHYH